MPSPPNPTVTAAGAAALTLLGACVHAAPSVAPPSGPRGLEVAPGGAYALSYEVPAHARVLHIGGQIPVAADGTTPADFDAQARQVWANVDRQLALAGMTRRDLVKVTTYLSDRQHRAANARIRREVLGDHRPTLTIVITGIYDPEWLLEIEAIAARVDGGEGAR